VCYRLGSDFILLLAELQRLYFRRVRTLPTRKGSDKLLLGAWEQRHALDLPLTLSELQPRPLL